MDKEQIFSNLSAKLGQTSLSERTIRAYIDANAPSEGEVGDEWYNTHATFMKSLGGQYSHDIASSIEEFKKNYKPNNPNPNPNPNPAPAPNPNQGENPEVTALKKQMEEMKAMWEGMQTKNREDVLRNGVIAKIPTPDTNKGLWEISVGRCAIDANTTEETLLEKVKSEYESLYKKTFGGGASPYGNEGGHGGGDGSELDDFFASKGGPWAKK